MAAACARPVTPTTTPTPTPPRVGISIIPAPTTLELASPDSFLVTDRTPVFVDANASSEVEAIGTYAANLIASRANVTARRLGAGESPTDSSIALSLDPSRADLGPEGYDLTVTRARVRLVASQPAGLFYGVQTFRQLLPPAVEHQSAMARRLIAPAAHVVDMPRFPWRGTMLDVARHFMQPEDVKRYIDVLALYKFNRL
ncbi:MAG TPA: glycoside hydrolase family 20 zincin-like fold domain-containing protein, partial [Gemmatimonadaceae bacterium]